MQIPGNTSGPYAPGTSSGGGNNNNIANTDAQFAAMLAGGDSSDPAAILKKITSNGIDSLWSWQIDQMKQQVANEVMAAHHLTAAQIAAMPGAQRAQLEQEIMKEVAQRVKQLVEQDMQKHRQDPLGAGLASAPAASSGGGGDIGALLDISA